MRAIVIQPETVVQVISQYTIDHDYPPSVRDLCQILGIKSSQTMHKHLDLLRAQGLITWEDNKPRTLRVL